MCPGINDTVLIINIIMFIILGQVEPITWSSNVVNLCPVTQLPCTVTIYTVVFVAYTVSRYQVSQFHWLALMSYNFYSRVLNKLYIVHFSCSCYMHATASLASYAGLSKLKPEGEGCVGRRLIEG